MSLSSRTVLILCLALEVSCAGWRARDDATARPRATIWAAAQSLLTDQPFAKAEDSAGFFTIGTMAGASFLLHRNDKYAVSNDGVITLEQRDSATRRLSLGSYALPSIKVATVAGRNLSVIVPLGGAVGDGGLSSGSFGIGASYQLLSSSNAEIGACALLLGAKRIVLTSEQNVALSSGLPLPAGASRTIAASDGFAFGLGVYVMPKL